ncbi:DUF2397 domain-containing protein [Candidatus Chlorohelix sp.]|uniref:DUF2397 domain-containing protein n=1 Tax=Candidatus Chlorohelix sp. TaxID=3139201 RepID=UPI0030279623
MEQLQENQEVPLKDEIGVAERPSVTSSNSFGLTDKIPIFNYLVIAERVGWYRTIMRVFLARHRDLYKYQLTTLEVWEAVRQEYDPTYSMEKCQNDLKMLEEWGNLITTYDASRHTSIQSFRSPALLYQATPLAIALETFLEQQRRSTSTLGSLRQGDLTRLWEIVERLDGWLKEGNTRPAELAEEWRRAFELFSAMAMEAAQYLSNLTVVARRPRASLEAYQSYKRAVVEYVTNFGQALAYYSVSFRERLSEWYNSGRATTLIEVIAANLEPPTLELEHRHTPEQLAREAGNQVAALAGWFAIGSNADSFRRAAAEVEKVVRRAEQLAAASRPNANYATDLDRLARLMLGATNPEEARQLELVAFAHGLPAHISESLAGPTGSSGMHSAWEEQPSVTPTLRAIGRARLDKTVELAISDNREAQLALIQRRLRERAEELAQFKILFQEGALEIGEVWLNSPTERAALLAVVRGCLRDSRFQYRAPDGSLIALLNPRETRYGLLRAPDGGLLMPRYRLVRKEE